MSEDDDRSPPSNSITHDSSPTRTCNPGPGSGSSSVPEYLAPCPDQVLENVLENVLWFLTSRKDRNAASLVCRSWYRVEALTRSDLFIGNCYAVSPKRAMSRFTRIRSVTLKGKPRFADFNLMPPYWGAHFAPWVSAMAMTYPWLEKVHLKRMSVTDDDLALLAESFSGFKELVLVCCDGFGTSGLAIVVSRCRQLKVLDLIESDVSDDEVDWISCFPDTETCLESLIFDCVDCPIDFDELERLVARSPSLKKLRLNRYVSIGQLYRLMIRAPHLTHLGTGSFSPSEDVAQVEQGPDYASAFAACKSLVCLSGFREIIPDYLPAINPVCANLTSLNFSFADVSAEQLKPIISNCHKLQIFWVLDSICDEGLQAVAATCKELRELRVFPVDPREDIEGPVSEVGLQAISEGCRKLQSILYFCHRMTNAAVVAMSKNCPDLVVFRLCIMGRHQPDHVTGEPMDEGFGAIVKNCKKLTRLAKLEIRDSPFGDAALLSGLHHYYNMRFLWMSACKLSRQGCQQITQALPRLVVEVIKHDDNVDMDEAFVLQEVASAVLMVVMGIFSWKLNLAVDSEAPLSNVRKVLSKYMSVWGSTG
ncbi:hypothetical protein D5086_010914 [Populus alba]|uniref:Uncharacterized protein n=1 Tax=Populus alba TaxID=43335 RepID=A0ACC4CAZ3_POPAL